MTALRTPCPLDSERLIETANLNQNRPPDFRPASRPESRILRTKTMKKIKALMNKGMTKLRAAIQPVAVRLQQRPVAACIFLALTINLLLEILGRRSVFGALRYLFASPFAFLCNTLIILLTLTIALFFKRRVFFMTAISTVWILLGIANCILLGFRTTPLSPVDFRIVQTAFQVIDYYLDAFDFILILLLLGAVGVSGVILWRKAPKSKPNWPKTLASFAIVLTATFLSMSITFQTNALDSGFGNLVDAYDKYGFAYCFSYGLFDKGVSKPDGYSKETVDLVAGKLGGQTAEPAGERRPNVIFMQLESFFDPKLLSGVSFSEDPVPVFTALKDAYPSGMLTVPTVGAGTVNTEFEVLTGMALKFFGAGEYPYKTILKKTACGSMAYELKELGYTATALHNNAGLFYERYKVFPMLGFDRYVSIEYMENVEYNSIGWAKDAVLTNEILKILAATDQPDFIYGISVQGHGKYSADPELNDGKIRVSGVEDAELRAQTEFYVNQLRETDAFLGELIAALEETGEDCVLVLYGDHMPALDLIAPEALANGSIYQTQYVVWSSFDIAGEDADLAAYQLGAAVLERLGWSGGVMQRLHQSAEAFDKEAYLEAMHLLQYDLLYGERYAAGGEAPVPSEMRMGLTDAEISGVRRENGGIVVTGTGFTAFSKISVNGELCETEYRSGGELAAADVELERNDEVCVCFAGDDDIVLSETKPFVY